MSGIENISGVFTQDQIAAAQESSSASSELGKDSFLKLLTTQLQYQDPLNPMENSEFVAQLAQFSSLEQLQGLSDGMESLYMVNMSMNNASMTNLIGKDVLASGDTFHYDGADSLNFLEYEAASSATSGKLTITDSDGKVVFSDDLSAIASGAGVYSWDGKDLNGAVCPEGDYTFSITATDADGAEVEIAEQVSGTIDGMDLSSGSPMLTIDGIPVELSSILSISEETTP